MVNLAVEPLVKQALTDGWAAGTGSLDNVQYVAAFLGWEVVSSRTGGPAKDTLIPTVPADAAKQSLSAKYGQGEQPLHTDGAHHTTPPDIVLLSGQEASKVPTLLWRFGTGSVPSEVLDAMRHGLFTVRSGKDAFLAPALDGEGLRFDPGCMHPSDLRARRVAKFFASVRESADRFEWEAAGTVLAIDNRRVLHARAAAEDEPDRVMHRVTLRLKQESK